MDSKGLTKENFFDKLEEKYPKAMKEFKEWIDQYKIDNAWTELFNEGTLRSPNYISNCDNEFKEAPKFHDLPVAMQLGIFIQFGFDVDPEPDTTGVDAINEMLREGFNDVFSTIENDTHDAS